MVHLDFVIPGHTWKDQLPTTTEAGEIVVANRTNRHHHISVDDHTIQPDTKSGLELSDERQIGLCSAAVLDDVDSRRQVPDDRGEVFL
jgi:hypothetical protein